MLKKFPNFRVWVKVMCILYKIKYHKLSFSSSKIKIFKIHHLFRALMNVTNKSKLQIQGVILEWIVFFEFSAISQQYEIVSKHLHCNEFVSPDFDQYVRFQEAVKWTLCNRYFVNSQDLSARQLLVLNSMTTCSCPSNSDVGSISSSCLGYLEVSVRCLEMTVHSVTFETALDL